MMRILVVEDNPDLAYGLRNNLEIEGYQVEVADDGTKGLARARDGRPDLIILDLMLPGMDGFRVLRALREAGRTMPVLILTARGEEADKVRGLRVGADDYVTKPFGVRELLARIHALLRRVAKPAEGDVAGTVFQIGAASIDPKTFQLKRGKAVVELTAKELKLLQLFHAHPGEVLSRDRLLNEVWGYNYYGTTRTLDQVIVQLRKKLGDNGSEPKHLLTVHGVGYKLAL